MPPRLFLRAAVAVLVVSLAPLSTWAAKPETGEPLQAEAKVAPAPLTEAECVAFGEEIARAFNERKSEKVVALFDPYALSDRVLRGIELEEDMRQGFLSTFIGGVKRSLTAEFGKFTEARFLRVQIVEGERRPLVRIVTAEGAMNFHAYVTARRANGRPKWVDVYVYLGGELISESMRRLVLPAFAEQNAGLLARLTRGENSYMKSLPLFTKVKEKIQAGELVEAKAILDGLPDEVKNTKAALFQRLSVGQKLGGADYLSVLDDWARCFPGDPSLELVCIDADFLRKDYAGAVRRIEALQRLLGGDPYLDYLKANTLLLAGRIDECRVAARSALAGDPAMSRVYDVLLQIELDAKNHAAIAALLDEVEAAYPGADMATSIAGLEVYSDFRASAEHAQWLSRRATRVAALAPAAP